VKVQEFKMRGLGTLKYDANLKWWAGNTKFQGKKIKLNISAEEENKFEPLDNVKHSLKKLETLSFDKIAAEHLLSLFNDSWNDDELNLTHEEFVKKIKLDSITLEPGGGSSIWFKDGNLFLGHSIHISLDVENKVTDVGIMG
jgi:hypothetical protein